MMGSPDAARRWVVPQPDVDDDAFLTVYNPGTIRSRRAPVDTSARRCRASTIAPRTAKVFEVVLDADDGALVVTAPQPIVVGLTLLGDAGASISTRDPRPVVRGVTRR